MRYENKLEVSFDIDPAVEEFPIVSYLIHPLAENAVKHGMRVSPMPLKIQITAEAHQGNLCIEVITAQRSLQSLWGGIGYFGLRLKAMIWLSDRVGIISRFFPGI